MKEMSMLHAEIFETWEYASGPATIVDEKFFCAALYTGNPKDEDTANSFKQSQQWGARVIEIGPRSMAGDWHIPMAALLFEPFSTLSLIPPSALLANNIARSRGHTPDTL